MTSEQIFEIDLEFRVPKSSPIDPVGVYIRTLNHFDGTIDYVGTAGEGLTRGLNYRLKEHSIAHQNGGETYLRYDFKAHPKNSFDRYLELLQKVAKDGYLPVDIFLPQMPESYPVDRAESAMRSQECWSFFVCAFDQTQIERLEATFESKKRGLKAIESHLQTLLRTFYVKTSGNEKFPLEIRVPKKTGDLRATRSKLLGHSDNASRADQIRIARLTLPFESDFSRRFKTFVERVNSQCLRRDLTNGLIYGNVGWR